MVISAVDEAHCRHTITGEVKVRVVGVGKLVEKYVMQNTISALELLDSVVARCETSRQACTPQQSILVSLGALSVAHLSVLCQLA